MRVVGRPRGRHFRAVLSVALLSLALAGCSGLGSLVTKSPATAYDLKAATSFPRHAPRSRGQLLIAEPTGLGPLDGERILVRPSLGELAMLGDAQWEERLPRLVQARLMQSFENANRLRVGRASDKIAVDFTLLTDLRAFEISAADGTATVEIAAKIVNERSGRILAARVLRASAPAPSTQGAGAVAAINEAFADVAAQIVVWAAKVV